MVNWQPNMSFRWFCSYASTFETITHSNSCIEYVQQIVTIKIHRKIGSIVQTNKTINRLNELKEKTNAIGKCVHI